MPDSKTIVINTSPLLALIAGLGDLNILDYLYQTVFVPHEVVQEILQGGIAGFGVEEFMKANFLNKQDQPLRITPFLLNTLDLGEAAVIQLALNLSISTVCIDEAVGRRIARLNNLKVTGSIGLMIKAKQNGYNLSMKMAIANMKQKGIYLGKTVVEVALREAGE